MDTRRRWGGGWARCAVGLAIALAGGAALAGASPGQEPVTIHVRAYIDGTSDLIVSGSVAHWHQLGAAAPGRLNGANEPTTINGVDWFPTWPDQPTPENRDCNCDSSTFDGVSPALPSDLAGATLSLSAIACRSTCSASIEGNALVIQLDDGPPPGGGWYEVEVTVTPGVPPPPPPPPTTSPPVAQTPFPVKSGQVTGRVTIKRPGTKTAVPLTPGAAVPSGSLIDTTHGSVRLPAPGGGSDVFYAGEFLVYSLLESGVRVVELRLAGGNFKLCGRTLAATGGPPPKKTIRSLWGHGNGHFRTKAKYGSVTVRGTFWLTSDRCDGSYFFVRQGTVDVRDFVKRTTIRLTAGHSYLAAPRH